MVVYATTMPVFDSRHLWYWSKGRGYGIPACCVARFCFDNWMFGRLDSYLRRGRYERHGPEDGFVPCGVFHKADRARRTQGS